MSIDFKQIEKYLIENQDKIHINMHGEIVWDRFFEKEFIKSGGDVDILHSCIEDCCYTIDDDDNCGEEIDFDEVIKIYKEMLED